MPAGVPFSSMRWSSRCFVQPAAPAWQSTHSMQGSPASPCPPIRLSLRHLYGALRLQAP